jgi:hypothetical protein
MRFSKFFSVVCILFVGGAAAANDIGAVSEVGAGRVGANVVRYIKTFNDSCLEVQVVSPDDNWKILSASSFCTFEGKSFDSDFADAGFEDISVKNNGVHLTLSITPLRPTGEERRSCSIPVEGTTIKELKCSAASK